MTKEKKPRLTKADLDARFTARQEKNRARREHKVTGEDIEKLLSERKAKRAQKGPRTTPGQRARTLSLGLGIALLAGSGVLAVATSEGTDAFNRATHNNEQLIASLQGDLRALPAADEKAAARYAGELEKQIASATAKAEKVADLQQEFAALLAKGYAEVPGNGAPSTALVDAAKHRKKLAPYFVERAFPVDDIQAYAPGSVLPFGADEIDPRFPWYVGYGQDGRPADPKSSKWAPVSIIATETPGVLEVTWLSRGTKTGDLLAWASASYYVDPGAFGSLTVGHTTIGERGTPSSDKAGA